MPEFFTGIATLLDDSFLQSGALWALNTIPGFPPIIQTVHILGIAVVMASAVLLNLRILGLTLPSHSITEMCNRVMPWFFWALASNFISGAFFVFGRPNRYFNNPVFAWKMVFLLLAIVLALYFYLMHRKSEGYWQQAQKKWTARGIALLSLGLWVMVCTAGRWIAYLEYLEYPLWTMEVFDAGPQESFLVGVENWPISQVIAATNWFPLLETIHIIAVTLVVGSILWVDLRLLGFAAMQHPISTMNRELLPWTWSAFTIATITGLGMYITRAASHVANPAFQWKMALLLLAGINMAYFHIRVYKNIAQWDTATATPTQLKVTGSLSLFFWAGVMLGGRWIGHIV